MITRLLATIIVVLFSTGFTAGSIWHRPTVTMGDPAGYVRSVDVRQSDLKNVCSFKKFQEGFRYTYMAMWNGRIEKVLELTQKTDAVTYYQGKLFYSNPNKIATLDADPTDRDDYSMCEENSYQQGKIQGFLYSLDDLKVLEEAAPK